MNSIPGITALREAQAALMRRPLQAVIDPLIGWCQWWRRRDDPLRAEAVRVLREVSGLSEPVIHWGLETSFGAWIGETGDEASAIRAMLQAEVGSPAALGAWVPLAGGQYEQRWVPAAISLQILAGNVFAATIHQLAAGLLARTGQILKPARSHLHFAELLHRTLKQVDPELAAAVMLLPFDPDDAVVRKAAIAAAEVITVTGSDATVAAVEAECAAIRAADGQPRAVHGFGHRLSAAYLARWVWEHDAWLHPAAAALAVDVCAYDQAGCLSPQIVFAEDCLPSDLPRIADALFGALQHQTHQWPPGDRDPAWQAARRRWTDRYLMDEPVNGQPPLRDDGTIAVALDRRERTAAGPGGRCLVLAPVGFPQGVLERLQAYRGQLGTLGVALHPAAPLKGFRQASGLFPKAGGGFHRLCLLGQMQTPPITEPHDGRPRVRLFLQREERAV